MPSTKVKDSRREAPSQGIDGISLKKGKKLTKEASAAKPKKEKKDERKRDERKEEKGLPQGRKTSSVLNGKSDGRSSGFGVARLTEGGAR